MRLRIPPPAYYYASFAALPLLGLLQTRILTALLGPAAYGALQLVTPLVSWCVILGGLGTPQFIVRFYSRDGAKVFWEGLSLALSATLVVGLLLGLLALVVDPGVPEMRPGALLAVLLVAAVFAGQLGAMVKALLRVQERHLRYNLVLVLERAGIVLGVALAVWGWRHAPVEAFLLGSTVGTIAVLLPVALGRRRSWRQVAILPRSGRLGEILAFGGPIVAVMILGEMFATLNRYVIGLAGLGTSAVARYVIGYTVATLSFQALYEPLATYIHPLVFHAWERRGQEEAHRILGRYLRLYAMIGATAGIGVLLARELLIRLVAGPQYLIDAPVFAALLASSFLLGFYRLLSTRYYLTRRTGELALSYLAALVLNLGGAVLLVGRHGLLGVALASAASAAVLVVVVEWRGRALARRSRITFPP